MHDTAMRIGRLFFQSYVADAKTIIEIGGKIGNGSLRTVAPRDASYIGVDLEPGNGVDLLLTDDGKIPVGDDTADCAIASSVFEHDVFFWATFLELLRVTKPGGYVYVNAPSNGATHRHPGDYWRFYADAGKGLADYAKTNAIPCTLIESFIANREADIWNDFVGVWQKADNATPPGQFLSDLVACRNIRRCTSGDQILAFTRATEDMELLTRERERASNADARLSAESARVVTLSRQVYDLSAALQQAQERLRAAEARAQTAEAEMEAIRSSTIWKASAPIRELVDTIRRQRAGEEASVIGCVDGLENGAIRGWARRKTGDEKVKVEFWLGDALLGSCLANAPREDLIAAGEGDGHCAFFWPVPTRLRDGSSHAVRVSTAPEGQLANNVVTVRVEKPSAAEA